ncbi:TonB-dependent receptor family protein [Achromobacter arsenitoxydans]|uniref:TonB-dependent Receptor Plug domain-containing protein 2 n=1 Tax=Achromobacter arsenitoxydans SY8 TaxID=477184 RepID=H0FEJ4_9BURK|nr:TonB-dependent receptor [Achromobacter arsenitoxydans]EHK63301.1 TonB-dependent Receptor Plug domain-containing protein 2 [Achromobacter arsenitoxydans SY8]
MSTPVLRQLASTLTLGALGLSVSMAQEAPSLSPVVVTGAAVPRALEPNVQRVEAELQAVPGGTNLIQPQHEVRLITLRDALDYQPGVIVQEFFGGLDQPRLNIRGSGIQSNPLSRGILLMQDGLPLNDADGSFIISLLEPRNAGIITVRRGANALAPGASTLGGEVDFQSITGTQGDFIRLGGGSFGTRNVTLAKGFQDDRIDGRFSFGYDKSDGYRHHSSSERTSFQGNVGFRRGLFENRTYLSYTDLKFDIPQPIPKARMYEDPRSVLGDGTTPQDLSNNVYKRDPHRDTNQFRLANRSFWGTEAFNQTAGVYWQHTNDDFTNPQVANVTDGDTYGLLWQLNGKIGTVDYRAALDWQRSNMDRDLYAIRPSDGQRLQRFGAYDLRAENRSAMIGLDWHLTPQFSVVGDLKYSVAVRDAHERNSGKTLDQDWRYATPKLGVIWQPAASQRWYANVSRSNEAPTFWEIVNGEVAAPMNPATASTSMSKLDLQRALTYEVGGDGVFTVAGRDQQWSVSLYRSKVEDELMSVTNENGTPAGTYNYNGRTRHQGIEAGLSGTLPSPGAGMFDYRIAYTLSDFRFRSGQYQGNRIAGVPRHLLSAEVMYRIGGWRFGPNVRWLMSDTETNHANAPGTQQEAYALLGFKIAYEHDAHWSGYLTADNLTDKTYASSYAIRNTATPAMPIFLPGNGRAFSAGVAYKF